MTRFGGSGKPVHDGWGIVDDGPGDYDWRKGAAIILEDNKG